jgi:hypothetical protein
MVWLGVIIMVTGIIMSVVQRIRKSRLSAA